SEQCRRQRVEVRFPSKRWIERAQPSRGFTQQRWRVAAVRCDERDLTAQQVDARELEVAEDARLGRGEQIEAVLKGARLDLRLRGGEGATCTSSWLGRQGGRPLKEGSRGS